VDGQVEILPDREVVGAVHDVAPHPSDPNILFIGTTNGGVWRSDNALSAQPGWTHLSSTLPSQSIGALEFDFTDRSFSTLVIGFGRFSSYHRGGSLSGVARTTDGGRTWSVLDGGGQIVGLNISGVAVRGQTIVVTANSSEGLLQSGVWRSTNLGASWTRISGAAHSNLPSGAAFDLVNLPRSERLYTNAGWSGIYRSDDFGETWSKVNTAALDAALTPSVSNVELALGPDSRVFVAVVTNGQLSSLLQSSDAGATWGELDQPPGLHPGAQGQIHLSIAADPTNAERVYVGGDRQPDQGEEAPGSPSQWPNSIGAADYTGRLFVVDASRARGHQATHITHSNTQSGSAPHADSRDMAFDAAGELLEADDGGVYRRRRVGASYDWFSLNGDLQSSEMIHVAWDAVADIVIGGSQDIGTPQQDASNNVRMRSFNTADGGDVAVDDLSTPGVSIRYSSSQYLYNFRRAFYTSANKFLRADFPALQRIGQSNPLERQFYTPIALNAAAPNRLIIGADNAVYESFDRGDTIREIGRGIRVNAEAADPIAAGVPSNPDLLFVGDQEDVYVRSASGGRLARSAAYPGRSYVVDIVTDPSQRSTAFVVALEGVFVTNNAGATWTRATGNLMSLEPGALHSAAFRAGSRRTLIVGAASGVYLAYEPFDHWSPLGEGLPLAPVLDLEYDAADRILVAATLGRGAWTLSLPD
jgi:hypothetical protein